MRLTCVHSDTTEYFILCWLLIVNGSLSDVLVSGGNSEDQSSVFGHLCRCFLMFEYFCGRLESCSLSMEKTLFHVCLAGCWCCWGHRHGQLSNSCSSIVLALAPENLVVKESSFKDVICWAMPLFLSFSQNQYKFLNWVWKSFKVFL